MDARCTIDDRSHTFGLLALFAVVTADNEKAVQKMK
jgi:hypothetical protein